MNLLGNNLVRKKKEKEKYEHMKCEEKGKRMINEYYEENTKLGRFSLLTNSR